jgi:microcystin-dependent protein
MGLEAPTYISDLVEAWPLGSDKIRQGDDHLRAIKKALKTTFPNLNGPVNLTPAALNALPTNFGAVLTELLKHVVPAGIIAEWSGTTPPTGWALCNGQTVAGYGIVPDLRDRFIIGAGNSYTVGQTGGSLSKTSSNAGGHTHTAQGTALTEAQMPAHNHSIFAANNGGSSNADGWTRAGTRGIPGEDVGPFALRESSDTGDQLISTEGSGATHTHTVDAAADHTHTITDVTPPFYALAFIIKVTSYVAP